MEQIHVLYEPDLALYVHQVWTLQGTSGARREEIVT